MAIALTLIALTAAGLMVGIEVSVAVFLNPIFDRLPANGGISARADSARILGRVMPFWYASSIILVVILAVLDRAGSAVAALSASAGLFIVSILLSIAVLVPINNRAKNWTAAQAPHDWRAQVHTWDRWHYLRLVVITGGFVALALGALQIR